MAGAIARAAEATGADFDYLLAQARLESALDPAARARTSSAEGLYQFIDSTWLSTLDRHGERLGYAGVAGAIETRGGRSAVSDPANAAAIMALKFDPHASAMMAGALAQDNRAQLMNVLGREPDATELYMAHFLGAAGAGRFLTALAQDPTAAAAALMPQAASANRSIFYGPGGASRSLGEVMGLMRGRMQTAMAAGGALPSSFDSSPSARFASAARDWASPAGMTGTGGARLGVGAVAGAQGAPPQQRPSMADLLHASFATGDRPMPAHVRGAYDRLKAMNL
ncbi:hypothetical protein AAW00_13845 [Aurantiacibacter luteus]|uniref:Transglycosylase SLT domain-containing protein n=1 Tax=Aurantiacibacter luteus TaxID=1581420 RepID=A0A0G9MKT2_9SPHN|nr:hypothetical protein AAW00_13845 [Aurantiacibacter luteus]